MPASKIDLEKVTKECLATIEREREREIISRRFGLFERRETLEQIGGMLGITRERVRQLEKSVLTRLKNSVSGGNLPAIIRFQGLLVETLQDLGNLATVSETTKKITGENDERAAAQLAFAAGLCPQIEVIEENDHLRHSVALLKVHDRGKIHKLVENIVAAVKDLGEPAKAGAISAKLSGVTPQHAAALSSVSKKLAGLNNTWGLISWPTVNPRNIRDKIYLILQQNGSHMHFGEIAEAIKQSEFKRKDVTTQAIHNELIKDKRFVLVGRGRYALREWGFKKGTVADVITEVLKKNGPLHRDDIVKHVLKSRFVKDTTILLNLQAKPQFKRVAKATYSLAE